MPTLTQFSNDRLARRFRDVLCDRRYNFEHVLGFFRRDDVHLALVATATRGEAPLAGVVAEFESEFEPFLAGYDAHTTMRFRQAVGVVLCMVMTSLGWRRTGRKRSLGTRLPVASRTTTPSAYRNRDGDASRWFSSSEIYQQA